MSEHVSNVDFIVDLMTVSTHSALIQVFVFQALTQYSQRVAACEPQALETDVVSGRAWHGCALGVQRKLAARLRSEPSASA